MVKTRGLLTIYKSPTVDTQLRARDLTVEGVLGGLKIVKQIMFNPSMISDYYSPNTDNFMVDILACVSYILLTPVYH